MDKSTAAISGKSQNFTLGWELVSMLCPYKMYWDPLDSCNEGQYNML